MHTEILIQKSMTKPRPCPFCRQDPVTASASEVSSLARVLCRFASCPARPAVAAPRDNNTVAGAIGLWNQWGDDRPRATEVRKTPKRKATKPVYEPTPAGREFALWFKTLMPPRINPPGWESDFGKAYDDLIISGQAAAEIRRVCAWARKDTGGGSWKGWSASFYSPSMLLTVHPAKKITYYDLFVEQMKTHQDRKAETQAPETVVRKIFTP